MTGKRTRYLADFKAKVALEALRGELTTAQLAAKHGIHHGRRSAEAIAAQRLRGEARRIIMTLRGLIREAEGRDAK
jgi:transposase-like protein